MIVKREPSANGEWCEFEERPGPAPLGAEEEQNCTTICIVYREIGIPQSESHRAAFMADNDDD